MEHTKERGQWSNWYIQVSQLIYHCTIQSLTSAVALIWLREMNTKSTDRLTFHTALFGLVQLLFWRVLVGCGLLPLASFNRFHFTIFLKVWCAGFINSINKFCSLPMNLFFWGQMHQLCDVTTTYILKLKKLQNFRSFQTKNLNTYLLKILLTFGLHIQIPL